MGDKSGSLLLAKSLEWRPMTKAEQTRLTTWRLKVLERTAERSHNVARTCRHFRISRQAFYKWKGRYDQYGEAGLCALLACAASCGGDVTPPEPARPRTHRESDDWIKPGRNLQLRAGVRSGRRRALAWLSSRGAGGVRRLFYRRWRRHYSEGKITLSVWDSGIIFGVPNGIRRCVDRGHFDGAGHVKTMLSGEMSDLKERHGVS
jgi:transposase-like protein